MMSRQHNHLKQFLLKITCLQAELNAFSEDLLRLPAIIVANKADLIEDLDARLEELKGQSANLPVVAVSALAGSGIASLKALLHELYLHMVLEDTKVCDD